MPVTIVNRDARVQGRNTRSRGGSLARDHIRIDKSKNCILLAYSRLRSDFGRKINSNTLRVNDTEAV